MDFEKDSLQSSYMFLPWQKDKRPLEATEFKGLELQLTVKKDKLHLYFFSRKILIVTIHLKHPEKPAVE